MKSYIRKRRTPKTALPLCPCFLFQSYQIRIKCIQIMQVTVCKVSSLSCQESAFLNEPSRLWFPQSSLSSSSRPLAEPHSSTFIHPLCEARPSKACTATTSQTQLSPEPSGHAHGPSTTCVITASGVLAFGQEADAGKLDSNLLL